MHARRLHRPGFALLEVIIVLGIMGAMSALSIPAYREYQMRSDLDRVAQQVAQGLTRAKLLATSGERDAPWGYYVPAGVLYKGESYANRDTAFDEVYPMPNTITVNGLLDVTYSRVSGRPSATGDIVLRALNDDERTIQVTIAVEQESLATNQGDVLTICHHGSDESQQTMTVPDATLPYHQSHGDTVGPCVGASSSSTSSGGGGEGSSSSGGGGGEASSSSSEVGGGGGGGDDDGGEESLCAKYTLGSNQLITLAADSTVTFQNLLAQLRFGNGGPYVPVHACVSTNGGGSYGPLFGGTGNCSGHGSAYGNALEPNGTDTRTVSYTAGAQLALKFRGFYRVLRWLVFNEVFSSVDGTGHVLYLRNGDTLSDYAVVHNQVPLHQYLTNHGMLNAQGQITIDACEILSVTDFNNLNTAGADFQDDVMLLQFN